MTRVPRPTFKQSKREGNGLFKKNCQSFSSSFFPGGGGGNVNVIQLTGFSFDICLTGSACVWVCVRVCVRACVCVSVYMCV